MSRDTGVSASADRATHEPNPQAVSAVPVGIADAAPSLADRNENFIPPHFDMSGGKLGETPILWQFRMAYKWADHFVDEYPDWDQCCTCWVFAVSEMDARRRVWDKFKWPGSVMPEAVASCYPERFQNDRDRELSAQATEAAISKARTTVEAGQ